MIGMREREVGGKRAVVGLAASVIVPGLMALASCSLGLDESLIGRVDEAGAVDALVAETAMPVDGGSDGKLPPIQPEGGVCTQDSDCTGTAGCLTAKCDLPRRACVFDVCRDQACSSSACDQAAMTCGAAKPYKYRASQFTVGAQIGCGGNLGRCFAAVYPFVFVGTTNGVLAFAADDPQNPAPASVPVTGLGFVPTQIIASGSRMFFLGTPAGTGPTSRVPIAYVDVPPNPFANKIRVTTVLAALNRPASDPVTLFPRANDTALLVDQNVMAAYASAAVEPPLSEPVTLTSNTVAVSAQSTPLAVSGTRLVVGQINGGGTPIFAFVSGAGSATSTTGADTPIATAVPATGPVYFTQSADGALFFAYLAMTSPPGQPGPPFPAIRAAKGYFIVADGNAPDFDPAAGIDLEVYGGAPLGTPSVGPVALLDAKTAMVTVASPANPTMQSNVEFVTRTPALAIVKNADMSPRRFPITLAVSQLAAAGSNGLGYVLAVDPIAPTAPTVYVFDPGCAP
jgi:hypothetical protein